MAVSFYPNLFISNVPVLIQEGGTAATTAADARTNLELTAGAAGDIWIKTTGDIFTGDIVAQGTAQILAQTDINNPGYSFVNDPDTGWTSTGANTITGIAGGWQTVSFSRDTGAKPDWLSIHITASGTQLRVDSTNIDADLHVSARGSGDIILGSTIDVSGNTITGVPTPVNSSDAVPKSSLDMVIGQMNALSSDISTVNGQLSQQERNQNRQGVIGTSGAQQSLGNEIPVGARLTGVEFVVTQAFVGATTARVDVGGVTVMPNTSLDISQAATYHHPGNLSSISGQPTVEFNTGPSQGSGYVVINYTVA